MMRATFRPIVIASPTTSHVSRRSIGPRTIERVPTPRSRNPTKLFTPAHAVPMLTPKKPSPEPTRNSVPSPTAGLATGTTVVRAPTIPAVRSVNQPAVRPSSHANGIGQARSRKRIA